MASGQLVRHIGELPRQSRVVFLIEVHAHRVRSRRRDRLSWKLSRACVWHPLFYTPQLSYPPIPCAPPLRAVYPNLAIGALGCTRLRGWCRDRRLEFRFGRRATRGWRVWIDQGNSCNRQLERRNRLRNPCRQGGLAILDQRSGEAYASKPELEAREGCSRAYRPKAKHAPTAQ